MNMPIKKVKVSEHYLSKLIRLSICFLFLCSISACNTNKAEMAPDSPESKKLRAAKINVRLGMAYLERNDIKRSKLKFLTALEQAPTIPETWYTMAYFLEKTGNSKQANAYYQKAILLAPERGDVLNNYGTYLCRNGKYSAAINYFLKATKDKKYLDPSAAYENAGLCAMKIPDNTLAMRFFNRALEEDSSRPTSLIEMAHLNYQAKNYQLASHHLQQYLRFAPASDYTNQLAKKLKEQV